MNQCRICKKFIKKDQIVCSEKCSKKLINKKISIKEVKKIQNQYNKNLTKRFLQIIKNEYAKSIEKKRWKKYSCYICGKSGERLNRIDEKMLCDKCYDEKIFIE